MTTIAAFCFIAGALQSNHFTYFCTIDLTATGVYAFDTPCLHALLIFTPFIL